MRLLTDNGALARRLEKLMLPLEESSKKAIFDCRMCGQCVLHSTGMTCPMTCPKNLRNGPCGGVRANGNCEVYPDKPCIWVQAIERSRRIPLWQDHKFHVMPPVDWSLAETSSWVNLFTGRDQVHPAGWDEFDNGRE